MKFQVHMVKEYEAYVVVEAESAQEACDMIADGDFSQAVDGSYADDLSEEGITHVRVYNEDDEECDSPLAKWDWE